MSKIIKFILVITIIASTPTMAAVDLKVEQGSIGRWAGEPAAQCYFLGKTYAAVAGVCYYPIDMDKRPAYYEIARSVNGVMQKATLEVIEKPCVLEEIDFPKKEYVSLSKEDAIRHWKEQYRVKAALKKEKPTSPAFSLPLGKPAEPLPKGDNFGVCRKFNGIDKHRHTGVDYPIGMGNAVLAVADGVVSLSEDQFFSGQAAYFNHGNGLTTMYFHLSELAVEPGDEVKKGESVGKVGSTGRSTGPHLHWGARWHNQRINPNLLIQDPETYSSMND